MYTKLLAKTLLLSSILTPAYSMEDDISNISPSVKHTIVKGNDTSLFAHFPVEINSIILQLTAYDKGNNEEDLSSLAIVCSYWNNLISDKKTNIKKSYFEGLYKIKDSQEKTDFDKFYNGKLIYRVYGRWGSKQITLGANGEHHHPLTEITWLISDLKNPLNGTFDLSKCEEGQDSKIIESMVSISTGYRIKKEEPKPNKTQVWIAPRFLIEKNIHTTGTHFQHIFQTWNTDSPIGIFWTLSYWDKLDYFDYLIGKSSQDISNIDLHKNWNESISLPPPLPKNTTIKDLMPYAAMVFEKFQFSFK